MSDELGLINYDSGEGDEVFLVKEIRTAASIWRKHTDCDRSGSEEDCK